METVMLSTEGTSVLTNPLAFDKRRRAFDLANAVESNLAAADRAFLDEVGAGARAALEAANGMAAPDKAKEHKRLSAELNGILSWEEETRAETEERQRRTHHVLLVTDTYSGRLAGGILNEQLLGAKRSAEIFVVKDLPDYPSSYTFCHNSLRTLPDSHQREGGRWRATGCSSRRV